METLTKEKAPKSILSYVETAGAAAAKARPANSGRPLKTTEEHSLEGRLFQEIRDRGYSEEALPLISYIVEHNPAFFARFKMDRKFAGMLEYQNQSILRDLGTEAERISNNIKHREIAAEAGKSPDTVFVVNREVIDVQPFLSVVEFGGAASLAQELDSAIFRIMHLVSQTEDSSMDRDDYGILWTLKRLRDAVMYGSKDMPVLDQGDDRNKREPFHC